MADPREPDDREPVDNRRENGVVSDEREDPPVTWDDDAVGGVEDFS